MGQNYLIDTNVIIDNFGNKLPEKTKEFLYSIDITVSAVTKIEVLGWVNASKNQLNPLYDFMNSINILPINDSVINKTIELRQSKKISLGDAIIAATTLVHELILITRNTNDFKNIKDLKVINPFKI